MFSPYYAWRRRRWGDDQALAEDHVAVNLSLYRRAPGRAGYDKWWTMTERSHHALRRDRLSLDIGPSQLAWTGAGTLQVDLDERTVPWPRRVRGRLAVHTPSHPARAFALDGAALHRWQPIAPAARIEVDLDGPGAHWQGNAYLDSNWGRRPLARDFSRWHWSRQRLPAGGCRVVYAVECGSGPARAMDLRTDAFGGITPHDAPPPCPLPPSGWGLDRRTCAFAQAAPTLGATLESGPFYCRSLLADAHSGEPWMHETLDLQRFQQPWVQAMLPFRMPRRAWRSG